MRHHLASTPETIRFGMFDAAFDPVLTIASGDSVTFDCVSGGVEVMPGEGSGLTIPPARGRSTPASPSGSAPTS